MSPMTIDWSYAWPEFLFDADGLPDRPDKPLTDATPFRARLERDLPDLPFLTLPFAGDLARQITKHTEFFRSFRHMLVLGIGGSALGARALQKAFFPAQDRPGHEGPWLWIADNIHPAEFEAVLDRLPPNETLVVVVSKSGGTLETLAQYFLCLEWLQKRLIGTWQEHLFVVTDAQKGFLRDEIDRHFVRSLSVPEGLGGRYSALSAVGLVPAAFMGVDWAALLAGAAGVGRPLAQNPAGLGDHPAWKLARWAARLTRAGLDQLIFFCYSPAWAAFGPWFAQLWAESLGKNGKGSMPVPAVGVTDQHSLLQMFLDGPRDKGCLFITRKPDTRVPLPASLPEPWSWLGGSSLGDILAAETRATHMSLARRHMPLVNLDFADDAAHSAGQLMMLLEMTTVFTGWLLGIDPLDQPAVEEGKVLARGGLGAPGPEAEATRAALAAFAATLGTETDVL